jgi:DNA mismatch repair protein MutS
MAVINDYFQKTNDIIKEYGEKSIVLMQIGDFFEVYGFKNTLTGEIYGSAIKTFATICNFNIATKSNISFTSVPREKHIDIVMAGCPKYVIEKWADRLQNEGFTCAVYTQDSKKKNTTRSLEFICSPGTHFINEGSQLSNNIMCIKLCNIPPNRLNTKARIIVGLANVDIYTGNSTYNEYIENYYHNPTTFDSVERFYSIFNPSEVIIIYDSSILSYNKVIDIMKFINIHSKCVHNVDINGSTQLSQKVKMCEKQTYQLEIYKQFFSITDTASFMDTNRFNIFHIGSQAYCFLLDFIYSHNPNLIKKIRVPTIENTSSNLQLANHSLKQLNIIDDNNYSGKLSSVVNFINNCLTPMGKRKFTEQLLHPTTNIKWLDKEYGIVGYIYSNLDSFQYLYDGLREITDIQRYYRKIILEKATPIDIVVINDNIHTVVRLFEKIKSDKSIMEYINTPNIIQHANNLMTYISDSLDLNICKDIHMNDINKNFFVRGTHPTIDQIERIYVDSMDKFNAIRQYFSEKIKVNSNKNIQNAVKIHTTDKSGSYLKITKTRYELLQKNITEKQKILYKSSYDGKSKCFILNGHLEMRSSTGNNKKISSTQIDSIAYSIITNKARLQNALQEEFRLFIQKLIEFNKDFDKIITFLTSLDVVYSKARLTRKYNYCIPTINKQSEQAFFYAKDLRHVLIEHLQTEEIYVPNNISLGKQECKPPHRKMNDFMYKSQVTSSTSSDISYQNGILLFGTNAVGKSSLIKSIGICVIMAQAGCSVPCSSFTYKPFHKIFTRILGNDNIFKSLSTFAVEMSELNTILRNSDENSLILGDELCSGTELGSAISIFAAGLIHLERQNSKFIFATHFHEITKMPEITNLKTLQMKHMSVIFDKEEDTLIYDRILRDGPGNNMYGLEVCKSLHLPVDFLETANTIRLQKYPETKSILTQKTSKYNSNKVKTKCEICNRICVEVHHLEHQKNANSYGFIGHFHKNHTGNLVNVCESCHIKFHKSTKKFRRKKTTRGHKILET